MMRYTIHAAKPQILLLGCCFVVIQACSGISQGFKPAGGNSTLLIQDKTSKEDLKSLVDFNEMLGQVRAAAAEQLTPEQAQKINGLLDQFSNQSVNDSKEKGNFQELFSSSKDKTLNALLKTLKEEGVNAAKALKIVSNLMVTDADFAKSESEKNAIVAKLKATYSELTPIEENVLLDALLASSSEVNKKLESAGVQVASASENSSETNSEAVTAFEVCSTNNSSNCKVPSTHLSVPTSELSASSIATGFSIAGVSGTAPVAPDFCTASADTGCVTTDLVSSLAVSDVPASKIATGTTIQGVAGTLNPAPAGLGTAPWNGVTAPAFDPSLASSAGCPANYVLIPSRKETNTGHLDFPICVSKYPMRVTRDSDDEQVSTSAASVDIATHTASTVSSGEAWVRISTEDAETECRSLGDGYRMLRNHEWQSIALLIEQVGANWETGTVGTGSLFVGLEDNAPISDITDPYSGAPAGSGDEAFGSGKELRRTSHLPNGEIIWDMVRGHEWVQLTDKFGNAVTLGVDDPNTDGTENGSDEQFALDSAEMYTALHSQTVVDDSANAPPEHLAIAPEMMMPGLLTKNEATFRYTGIESPADKGYGTVQFKNEARTNKGVFRGFNGLFSFSSYAHKYESNWDSISFRCVYVP